MRGPIYDLDAMNAGQLRAFIEENARTRGPGWRTMLAMARNRLERLTSPRYGDGRRADYYATLYHRLPPELRWRDKTFAPQICALPGKVIRRKPRRIIVKFNALQQEKGTK